MPASASRLLIGPRWTDQARTLRAHLACTLVNSSILLRNRQKGCRIILSAAPADGIFAADCNRTEIRRFRLKGSLRQYISPFAQKKEQRRESTIA